MTRDLWEWKENLQYQGAESYSRGTEGVDIAKRSSGEKVFSHQRHALSADGTEGEAPEYE